MEQLVWTHDPWSKWILRYEHTKCQIVQSLTFSPKSIGNFTLPPLALSCLFHCALFFAPNCCHFPSPCIFLPETRCLHKLVCWVDYIGMNKAIVNTCKQLLTYCQLNGTPSHRTGCKHPTSMDTTIVDTSAIYLSQEKSKWTNCCFACFGGKWKSKSILCSSKSNSVYLLKQGTSFPLKLRRSPGKT